MRKLLLSAAITTTLAGLARAADLRVPESSVAGQAMTISISGANDGVLYLIGPS